MPENITIPGSFEPEAVKGARLSGNFLEVLGARPPLGPSFLAEEDRPAGSQVAMISWGLWQRLSGAMRECWAKR